MGYGAIEVPNIRLVFFNKGTQVRIIDIDTVVEYDEEVSENEASCVIRWAILNPLDYDFILSHQYTDVLMYRSMIIRSEKTGKDELYFPPTLYFNKITFEYYLEAGGNPARWTLRLMK